MADDLVVLPVVETDVRTIYGPWDSSSRPGLKHYTFEKTDGTIKCTCEGFKFRSHCKHVNMIQDARGEQEDFDVSM